MFLFQNANCSSGDDFIWGGRAGRRATLNPEPYDKDEVIENLLAGIVLVAYQKRGDFVLKLEFDRFEPRNELQRFWAFYINSEDPPDLQYRLPRSCCGFRPDMSRTRRSLEPLMYVITITTKSYTEF